MSQPSTQQLDRRWFVAAAVVAFLLAFTQSPGLIVADTKYDLTQNPLGFLSRASHLWSSQSTLGQVQNQAYGYFFPHGAFFSLGHVLGIPPWMTQRIWWALLILAGFWGIVRLAEAIGIGSRSSRIIAGIAFALCPRVLTTVGSISSETLPMMLAPWVLLPVVLAFGQVSGKGVSGPTNHSPGRLAAQSAVAVALMGAVNAVATAAACLVAVLWWASHKPNRRFWVFTAWWVPCVALATVWWLVPLLILGKVSPPFLDYIESAGVTTQWASLAEVLRGTDSWTPFVSPERIAGAVLVTQPAAVVATGLIAAAGLAGLAMRSMPAKGRLFLILGVGLAGLTAGYVGELGSPVYDSVRHFLDSGGAPLRNVHKLEPLIRLPLVLGLAHLLAQVPMPASVPGKQWRSAFAHPERKPIVALTGLILVALTLATSLAWNGNLAPRGAYDHVPDYWSQAADWLDHNTDKGAATERALVVPGAPIGSQVWGLTRDEPLQALAKTPWAVRDAVPLNPPGAIRAMDSVQRLIADGQPSAGLAETLLGQGIGYLVLRNDLDPDTSRSTRPMQAHQAIEESPGIEKVAEFGPKIGPGHVDGLVADGDLRPNYPAVQIFRVDHPADRPVGGPYTVDLKSVPVVAGGPESLQRRNERDKTSGPVLLAADAQRAGLPLDDVTVTDTPTDRETDFGQVDNHSSALRAADDPRRTLNLVPDYPVDGAPLVEGEWTGAKVTVSSSAADATQLGGSSPGAGAAAAVDGDDATSWVSNGLESAVGQWLRLDLDKPIKGGLLHLTTSAGAIGAPVKWIEVRTATGSTAARVDKPGKPLTVALPPGKTSWVQVISTETDDGSVGSQFGISELSLDDYSNIDAPVPVDIRHHTVLPETPPGATIAGWQLGQELPGRTGCVDAPDRVRCSKGLAQAPEEMSTFTRTLSVPTPTTVRPELTLRSRQGPALESLLAQPDRATATGAADIADVRGSAYAATDGDPKTTWTAPEDSVRKIAGAKPTLTITLPQPTLVSGLDLQPSIGNLPAAPTSVTVNLGDGPQVRKIDTKSSKIELHPHVTDRIELSLDSWRPVLDQTALGFAQLQPAGLAEVTVLGEDGKPIPGSGRSSGTRTVTVDCDRGPVVSIGGTLYRTSVTATADQLESGAPVEAQVCEPNPVPLPAGQQEVAVSPGAAFVVDGLDLPTGAPVPTPTMHARPTAAWTENHREISVDNAATDQLLVVPQSNNVGWQATGPGGQKLKSVVVNGWQQGWVVPAGTGGTVNLDFPKDRWYRLGIFGGLVLLLSLFGLALFRRKKADVLHYPESGPAPRTWRSSVAGFVGLLALTTVISGPTGPALTIVLAGAAVLFAATGRSATRVLVGVAGVSAVIAMAVLSRGPWRSPDGYIGHSMWVQLPALIAVIAVGLSALVSPSFGPPILRRLSQRFTARRTGSSTSA
ncbi:alpha-(1-_3)-arabinofuranosyltransferase [Antrihabitans cavernicola]|uniref:DUF3367 domain-containing protein n=1 Tax=Antrihabitans cavernicola TaxID=2495913 RepID=A0A5A7S1Q7_9NOCA|nr:DUF3367 domain-containing protein [Spelaeibacter cavernicola]